MSKYLRWLIPATISLLLLVAILLGFQSLARAGAQPAAWYGTGTPIPNPWMGRGIQCPGDTEHFYLVGGTTTGFVDIHNLRRYDVQDGSWHDLADLHIVNRLPALACYQGKIYAAGGWTISQGLLDTLYIYDIASDFWSSGANLPDANFGAALGAWDGKLYLAGGNETGYPFYPVPHVHVYDIALNTWTPNGGASMLVASDFGGSVQAGSYLYVVGGLSGNFDANLPATQRYDMATNHWEQGPLFASRRADTALAITDEYLYAVGGDANGGGDWDDATDTVERLDLSLWPGGTWTDSTDPLPDPLLTQSFCSESLAGGEIWAVGGLDASSQPTSTLLYRPSEPCINMGVELAPDSLAGEGYRSMGTVYTLTITNTGDTTDYFSVVATGVWTVTLPAEIGPLGPGESAALPVSVAVPYEAALGDWDTAVITATSMSNPVEWDSSTITTTAVTGWTAAQSLPGWLMGNLVQCPDQPNSFYLVGGIDLSDTVDTLWRFDAETNEWTDPGELADMPAPRRGVAAACYQGKIYVAGGWNLSEVFSSLFIYDIATNTWETGPHLPNVIWAAALGAWDGKLYLVGGTRGLWPWTPVNRVDVYDINLGVWMAGSWASMPTAASFFGSVQRGPYLYAVGGYSTDPNQNVDQTQRYDMAAGTWEAVHDFPSARAVLSVATTRAHLYSLVGDLNPANGPHLFTDLVDSMDLSAWPGADWMNFDPFLRPRSQIGASVCTMAMSGGEIWVVGGDEPSNVYHPTEPCLGYNYAVELSPAALEGSGDPGEIVSYTLTVSNMGDTPDAYNVLITSTWSASAAPFDGALDPGESAELVVSVQVPAGARADEQDVATVTIVSQGDGSISDSAALTTTALPVYRPDLGAEETTLPGFPGQVVTYTLHLTNTGNITDTFEVSFAGNLWAVTVPITGVELAAGDSVDVLVYVTVADGALPDEQDKVTITATSQGDAGQSAQVELTTTAVYGRVFLPVVRK